MKSACEILFILSGGWNSATCTWNKLFPRGALKNGWSEKLLKITGKHKKQSSGGVLWKDVLKNFANLTEKCLCWSPFFNKAAGGNLKLSEASTGNVLLKKVFLKRRSGVSEPAVHTSSTQNRCFWTIHKIRSKIPVLESLFNKVAVLNFIKEDSNTGAFPQNLQTF